MSSTSLTPELFGVTRALQASSNPSSNVGPTLFTKEFSLADRVALVTGARRGIGLEAALALAEGGARAVYCLDLPEGPGEEWTKVREFTERSGLGKFEYISGDVRKQEAMWKIAEKIGDMEGRLDICVAAAGILGDNVSSLEYKEEAYQDIVDVNLKGVLFTAQGAGRQMVRFGNGGSIILISSICGHVAVEPHFCTVAYHTTKAGVHQLARSMACELGRKGVRVNTVSPGFMRTQMISFINDAPEAEALFANANPLGRIANPHEVRGVVAWLASDASSFCTGTDFIVDGGHHAW
ncbi:sorbose reductase sou1 [Polyporus arcularius HHB13444]|uniref:Sorbose reductase sou1 n=1 Tax=Polyporus arcularius HHB13444 TaxID=1314778 RepID=A0A5C3P2F0_9APHY|nr:sorbose reductase sou1 [Polyporus arcularius HHB13444]